MGLRRMFSQFLMDHCGGLCGEVKQGCCQPCLMFFVERQHSKDKTHGSKDL